MHRNVAPAAQVPATSFRRGQWAMQFAVTDGARHVGFLKFRSPTSAWLLDVGVNGDGYRARLTAADSLIGRAGEEEVRRIGTQLTLGRRGYRAITARAVRHTTIGLSGGHDYGEVLADGRSASNHTSWNGGIVLDLGGAYFLSPGVSIGGALGLGAFYRRSERNTRYGTREEVDAFDAGLDAGQLLLTIHF